MVTSTDFHADSDRADRTFGTDAESFRSAFDYAAIGMALVAPDGRWLKVNRSVCELLGYSEPERCTSRQKQSCNGREIC
jgi:PAS domain-containing protein